MRMLFFLEVRHASRHGPPLFAGEGRIRPAGSSLRDDLHIFSCRLFIICEMGAECAPDRRVITVVAEGVRPRRRAVSRHVVHRIKRSARDIPRRFQKAHKAALRGVVPAARIDLVVSAGRRAAGRGPVGYREAVVGQVIQLERSNDRVHILRALGVSRLHPRRVKRRENDGGEEANDGNDDQEFDESEPRRARSASLCLQGESRHILSTRRRFARRLKRRWLG